MGVLLGSGGLSRESCYSCERLGNVLMCVLGIGIRRFVTRRKVRR